MSTAQAAQTKPAAVRVRPGDALLVVDVQHDFLPGGRLAVPNGDAVVPVLNRYIARFQAGGLPIFASRDWHPPDHCSFKERGGPWPVHCVAGTEGAAPPAQLALPPSTVIVYKGTDPHQDAYSAFQGTPLDKHLREAGIQRVFVGGLATDYCVLNSVRDAREHGYQVFLLTDASRAVNLHPEDGRKAEDEMVRRGAVPICWENLAE